MDPFGKTRIFLFHMVYLYAPFIFARRTTRWRAGSCWRKETGLSCSLERQVSRTSSSRGERSLCRRGNRKYVGFSPFGWVCLRRTVLRLRWCILFFVSVLPFLLSACFLYTLAGTLAQNGNPTAINAEGLSFLCISQGTCTPWFECCTQHKPNSYIR